MHFVKKWIHKLIFSVLSTGCATVCFSQDAAATQPTKTDSANQFILVLGIVAIILAFVIYGMGQVLLTMGRQVLEKNNRVTKIFVAMLLGCTLLSLSSNAQEPAAAETTKFIPNYGGMDSTGFWTLVTVLAIEVGVIVYMMFSIQRLQAELLPPKQVKKWFGLRKWWTNLDKKLFTKAISVEKEADVMLDHDYDGIRELDNALPPWWKYGFIITIVIAFIYLLNFHVLGYGKNPTEEYQAELLKAGEDKAAYEAKNKDKVDEANIKMPSAEGIKAGKEIFTSVCWACHGKQGEGGAGPNLTDDYWLHKGSLSDIYLSIKHGYPDKGMQAWEKNYSLKEINNIAGFIKTLRGTNPPNSKAAQGDLFTEENSSDSSVQVATVDVKKDSIGQSQSASQKK